MSLERKKGIKHATRLRKAFKASTNQQRKESIRWTLKLIDNSNKYLKRKDKENHELRQIEPRVYIHVVNLGTILDFLLYLVEKKLDIPSWPTYHPTISHFCPIMPDLPT